MIKILVLRGGALGDFIVTLPALKALRDQWPEAQIHLVGNVRAATLGLRDGLIDQVESQHDRQWQQLYSDNLDLDLRMRLTDYDAIINFWPDPEHEIFRHFPLRSGQQFVSAPALPTRGPAAMYYADALKPLGVCATSSIYRLRSSCPRAQQIALHPGSGSPTKNWPLEHWLELAKWLQTEMRATLRIVMGEAESTSWPVALGEIWRDLPLDHLADRLSQCTLFLGHDSGISHLAVACGCRSVLLFGPTNPTIWAPPTDRVTVIQRDPVFADITVSEVKKAVASALGDQT